MVDTATTVKKTTRLRKTASSSEQAVSLNPASSVKTLKVYEQAFSDLLIAVRTSQEEFTTLQKEIDEVRESWKKEQKDREAGLIEKAQQEEIARKRNNETYVYETNRARKAQEDEFTEKKAKWERELELRKEEIAKEKQELEMFRKQVAGFEEEKNKAIKEACALSEKQLQTAFITETKLREQETKSEKELLVLKITNLTQENGRLNNEIISVKKSLEDVTRQLREVAVKVIESSGPQAKPSNPTEA